MAYLLFFEISLGPIFWVMIAEIYPLRSRAKGPQPRGHRTASSRGSATRRTVIPP
jgi:hypothetical protein